MPRFSANLTMLWTELSVLGRFRAAAEAGFRKVEILFVHELDPAAVERTLREHRLELVLFDPRPGDWAKGERGLLSLPGREVEFLQTVRKTATAVVGEAPFFNISAPGTDSRVFRRVGMPVAVFGPTPYFLGAANEHVTVRHYLDVIRVHALSTLEFLRSG